eukprot:m.477863 g.477863  ORF g.477863 m.477863 type:complete len:371 (+) comp20972_c0_seq1:1524-2636(+)
MTTAALTSMYRVGIDSRHGSIYQNDLANMLALVAVCALVASAAAAPAKTNFTDVVAFVNSNPAHGWVAEEPIHRFGSYEDVKKTLGTFLKGHPQYVDPKLPQGHEDLKPLKERATDFDSRTAWPNCTVISKVRDQSACGSCWAFGSTEAFEDRRCVATGKDEEFSAMDTAGCCKGFLCGMSMGCNGGQPSAALNWMSHTGVVSGGDFYDIGTSNELCKAYSLKPCAHHVPPSSKYPACPSDEYSVSCQHECTDKSFNVSYSSDKHKGTGAFGLNSVAGMETAIQQNGPLAVAFTVYADFPTYKSGVYKHVSGQALGGHAVEMVGWGTMDGQDYWWIKNSWNEQWGDGGFFKIAKGNNECGIESDVTGIRF